MYEIILNKTTITCYVNSNSKLMANNLNGKRMVSCTKIDYSMFSKDNILKKKMCSASMSILQQYLHFCLPRTKIGKLKSTNVFNTFVNHNFGTLAV